MELYHSSPIRFTDFDLDKVGNTTQVNKYGFGFYFSESYSDVVSHARQNTLPKQHIFIYTVKVLNSNTIVDYEDEVSNLDAFYHLLKQEEINELNELEENYGITYRELYDYLESVYGVRRTSAMFNQVDICGFRVEDAAWYDSPVYLIFSPSNLRIRNIEQIK